MLEYFDIKADVSGYVIKRNVAEKKHAKAGSILFEIADLNHVWIIFDAYEKDLSFIKKGGRIQRFCIFWQSFQLKNKQYRSCY